MNAKDKSISKQLEWTQRALDALKALPPEARTKLSSDERQLHDRKRNLEKHTTRTGG